MHFRVRQKLSLATRLYLTEPELHKTVQLKIQLPDSEFVEFNFNQPIPKKFNYISLLNGGFNYDPLVDTRIIHYSAKKTINILRISINYRNNTDTIEQLIELIEKMENNI